MLEVYMPAKIEETGNVYGDLIVISEAGISKTGKVMWLCECSCGRVIRAVGSDLRNGRYSSCGCKKSKHGLRNHPFYGTWRDMITRCYNQKSGSYKHYGGRGIGVCEEWRKIPKHFIEWCERNGKRDNLQVDRIDNDGNYSPENCRLVTPHTNNCNKRIPSTNKTGVVGVHIRNGKFVAQIQNMNHKGGGKIYIGQYNTLNEAAEARREYIARFNLTQKH